MSEIRELKFFNFDATPKEVTLHVSDASVAPIMQWYGSHYSGDRYHVYLDRKRVEKDCNGILMSAP